MSTICDAFITSHSLTALPPRNRVEMVWVVLETAGGRSIVVARWTVPGDKSGAIVDAAEPGPQTDHPRDTPKTKD